MRNPLHSLYNVREDERRPFGIHWCGPDKLPEWTETLCAVYEPVDQTDGGSRRVEVSVSAAPAQFFTVKVFDRVYDGRIEPGYTISTGAGGKEIPEAVAAIALQISRGMIEFKQNTSEK